MIRTMTAMLSELSKIRDRFSSTDIPISVDGRWINSIEVVSNKRLAEDMLRIFNNVDKMYKRYGDRD